MRTLGLIGGLQWVSTLDYYRLINQMINERLGGMNSAKILLSSVNMEEFRTLIEAKDWEGIGGFLSGIAMTLEKSGAQAIVICSNTPHLAADAVRRKISIPLIHIAEVTAKEIVNSHIKKVILLGTKATMEQDFFKNILRQSGIETLIPDKEDREFIHTSIFAELGKGIVTAETKQRYLSIISKLQVQGAEGVILGCTEIPLLIKPEDCSIKTLDTLLIHAKAAVEFALG